LKLEPRRISWDGLSFEIPHNWELAVYKFLRRGVVRIEVEDEYALRMEAEWVRPRHRLQMDTILARYEKSSRNLTSRADRREEIGDLPRGWFATRYLFGETMPSRRGKGGLDTVKHELVTAFFICPESSVFCFLLLHFMPDDKEDPVEVTRLVAHGFKHHRTGALVPWQLFDIAFEMPRDFVLENTNFDVGSKLMIFRWKLRRFHLWHFSCADMFLKEGDSVPRWLAGHINGFAKIRGAVFYVDDKGDLAWKRRMRYPFGHRDELMRRCLKYRAHWWRDREKNQLIAWVFNYRHPDDLDIIPESLRVRV